MNKILFAASSVALFTSLARISDEPRFAVEAKSSVSKSFETTVHLASTRFHVSIAGEDEPSDEMGDVSIALDNFERIELTDEYVAMGKDRPAKLKRTFDKLSGTQKQVAKGPEGAESSPDDERKEESPLEGKSVLFTWNEDASKFDATFVDGKGDEKLLAELVEDTDFRAFLPKGKVAKDEGWDVDPKSFDTILAPGGDLKLDAPPKEGEEADESEGDLGAEIRKHLDGKVHATWKGVRDEDGHKVGIIALTAELESEGDLESKAKEAPKVGFKAAFDLEGELAWDLAAGHFRSFRSSGKARLSTKSSAKLELGEESVEMSQEVDFEGEFTFKASAQ
ncbi:MAG TPA: hypothetical protein VGR31_11915 [Planctomycetota bacterium]|jgi:hypothetical protein|nr:hypothetical protein [Planctomycetota bacterium]